VSYTQAVVRRLFHDTALTAELRLLRKKSEGHHELRQVCKGCSSGVFAGHTLVLVFALGDALLPGVISA
jgi:hypothetical protein